MKSFSLILIALFSITLAHSVVAQLEPTAQVEASSKHIVQGEASYITYSFEGLPSSPKPVAIDVAGLRFLDSSSRRRSGIITHYLIYRLVRKEAGECIIPAVEFEGSGVKINAKSIKIKVHPTAALSKKTLETNNKTITYYTLLTADKSVLFPKETTGIEYKLYLPSSLRVDLWGLPLGERTNSTAWRFSTPGKLSFISSVAIDGKTYQSARFATNLTPQRAGTASIGPLRGRIVHIVTSIGGRGAFKEAKDFHALSDKLELKVKPLPSGQPKSFQGDVGNYKMNVQINAPEEISDADSIAASVRLFGKGNLSSISPPKLTNMTGWKVIAENKTDLGDARKSDSGIAEFTYLLQPELAEKSDIPTATPGFEFAYLNPETAEYQTISLQGLPITIHKTTINNSATEASNSATSQGLAALISDPSLDGKPWYKSIPLSIIHLLPLSICLLIVSREILRKKRTKKLNDSEKIIRQQALERLESNSDQNDFLKAAGAYIERWIDTDINPQAHEILKLRDKLCFQPNHGEQSSIRSERRKKILDILGKLSLISFFFILTFGASLQASESKQGVIAYEGGDYTEAIKHFQKASEMHPSADLYYNLGNSYYKTKQIGKAALNFHRALELNPSHDQALANLDWIEQNHSSITVKTPSDIERWIAYLSPSSYRQLIYFFCLILLTLALIFIYLRPRKTKFNISIACSIFTIIFLILTILCYVKHPNTEIESYSKSIILESSQLLSTPVADSKIITNLPTASVTYLIADRGRYSYVKTPNGDRGWVKSEVISPIIPKLK